MLTPLEVDSFAHYVTEWVQNQTARIIEATKLEMTEYFNVLRKATLKIGKSLLDRSALFIVVNPI